MHVGADVFDSITRALVHEKEQRMREAMKLMGLSNWVGISFTIFL
jgi:hypothetical protein